MTKLSHEILIAAPIERVWSVLADLEAVRHYNPMVSTARYTSKTRDGVGATRICEFRPGGSATERVTSWKPLEMMEMEAADHPWPLRGLRWRNVLASESGGTRLRQTLEFEFVGDQAMASTMEAQWDQGMGAIFESLKVYVESNDQQKH